MNREDIRWADTHWNLRPHQMNDINRGFAHARRTLDILPVAYYPFVYEDTELRIETIGNRPEMLEHWDIVCDTVKQYNTEGEFTAFRGYEWNGNRTKWGDHNVYYPDDEGPLLDTFELPDLFEEISRYNGIAIPHHTGYQVGHRGKDWSFHDENISPAMEVFSGHGSSERPFGTLPMNGNHNMGPRVAGGTAVEGLNRGYKFGLIASGDNHGGLPGVYRRGLMGVIASENTRKSVWQSILNRHVYGVTGDRIKLLVDCIGNPMGSSIRYTSGDPLTINFEIEACDEIERVQLIKNGKIVDEILHLDQWHYPKAGSTSEWKVRISTGWGPTKDHGYTREPKEWACSLEGAEVTEVEGCFTNDGNRIIRESGNRAEWKTRVPLRGGFGGEQILGGASNAQAVIVGFRTGSEDSIRIKGNGLEKQVTPGNAPRGPVCLWSEEDSLKLAEKTFELDMSRIDNHDVIYHTADKMLISRVLPEQAWKLSGAFVDEAPGPDTDYYYIRVKQVNGHMAWSSPIWIRGDNQTAH